MKKKQPTIIRDCRLCVVATENQQNNRVAPYNEYSHCNNAVQSVTIQAGIKNSVLQIYRFLSVVRVCHIARIFSFPIF